MASYTLSGRNALVTGGARGIGLETARALQSRGAQVVICDLDAQATEAAAASIGAVGLQADVTDRERMDAVVAEITERFGGLDVVVANAGIAPPPATALRTDEELFERVLDVNLMGVWRTVRAGLPQIAQRGGHVVVVASIYAFTNGMGQLSYAMAKAGVEQLGRGLRAELRPRGASATVAYFGFIDTEMVHAGMDRNPHGEQMLAAIPPPLRKRLPPSAAAEGIVRGIEKRSAQVILPRRWALLSAIRGGWPASDAAISTRPEFEEILRTLDA